MDLSFIVTQLDVKSYNYFKFNLNKIDCVLSRCLIYRSFNDMV